MGGLRRSGGERGRGGGERAGGRERALAGGEHQPVAVRLKRRIVRRHFVRLHMGLILAATAAAGLVASKGLLDMGVSGVMVRYPLAVVIAYVMFLGMAGLWIRYVVKVRGEGPGYAERAGDVAGDVAEEVAEDVAVEVADGVVDAGVRGVRRGVGEGGSWDLNLDSDEGTWILLALAAVVLVVCGAGAYLIWAAPEILPEIAVSALLASSLKRRAREAEAAGWVKGLVASTALPFGAVLATVCGLAYAVERTCPGAVKLLEAVRCAGRVE
ncbi:MAG: hypothetical protein IPJ98_09325 [Bryobacterales bacterium]|nr:hypothetical protein [Bryobacterales bacterium]